MTGPILVLNVIFILVMAIRLHDERYRRQPTHNPPTRKVTP